MSVYVEIDRLRSSLIYSGVDSLEAYDICDLATQDINDMLADLVSSAMDQALSHAIDIGAEEFVDDVQIVPDANGLYKISTHSGNLDYSRDKKEMLPHLLKNAEISKSGNRYKVIPLKDKKKTANSMFTMLQAKQDIIDETRQAIREHAKNKSLGINRKLRTDLGSNQTTSQAHPEEVQFRTASDKQNPGVSWVIPEKDADMTAYISELNQQLAQQASQSIIDIVESYYLTHVGR